MITGNRIILLALMLTASSIASADEGRSVRVEDIRDLIVAPDEAPEPVEFDLNQALG